MVTLLHTLISKQIIRFDPAVATLGGLQDHNLLHFTFVDAPVAAAVGMIKDSGTSSGGVTIVSGPTLLLFRFKPDNIFHGKYI